jgi:hypothetical protein
MRSHEGKGLPDPGEVAVKKAGIAKPALKEVQQELADNLRTVGALLHPLLLNLKLLKLQNPGTRIQIPRTKVDLALPAFDTHLAFTVISRSDLTAKTLVDRAADNETLLKWLIRFNSWFKGGEVGQLVGAHVSAAAGSLGVSNGIVSTIQGALISDVLEQVQTENYELRRQLEEAHRQMATQGARDGRGSGN